MYKVFKGKTMEELIDKINDYESNKLYPNYLEIVNLLKDGSIIESYTAVVNIKEIFGIFEEEK